MYLKLSLNALSKRLGNLKGRGVLLREGQNLTDLYEERTPLYEKYADIVIDEEGKDLEASLEILLKTLKEKLRVTIEKQGMQKRTEGKFLFYKCEICVIIRN